MIRLPQAKVGDGVVPAAKEVYDSTGTGALPVQTKVTGTVSFRLLGRVDPTLDWVEIRAPSASGYLESMNWVPWMAVEVVSGTGTVDVAIGEK